LKTICFFGSIFISKHTHRAADGHILSDATWVILLEIDEIGNNRGAVFKNENQDKMNRLFLAQVFTGEWKNI
jgi:hypothetical protein